MDFDLDEKINLFAEYLNNGGVERINHEDLLESLLEVKWDLNGKVIPDTVNSLVRAAINAHTGSQLMEPYMSDIILSRYETLLQKKLFFDTKKIETFEDFLSIYKENNEKSGFIYRGLNESDYRLYTSLQRYWILNRFAEKNIIYQKFIQKLIDNALSDPSIRKHLSDHAKSDLSVLSILQHYGTPTPLLDWTFSLSSALLFGLNGLNQRLGQRRDIENYFSVYYIEEIAFRDNNLKNILEEGFVANLPLIRSTIIKNLKIPESRIEHFNKTFTNEKLIKVAKHSFSAGIQVDLTKIEKIIELDVLYFSDYAKTQTFDFGLNNNPNIIKQKGVFMWNNNPTKPIEHMINISLVEHGYIKNPHQLCYCWDIHKNLSDKIAIYLAEKGFIYENLFSEPLNSSMKTNCKNIFDKTVNDFIKE